MPKRKEIKTSAKKPKKQEKTAMELQQSDFEEMAGKQEEEIPTEQYTPPEIVDEEPEPIPEEIVEEIMEEVVEEPQSSEPNLQLHCHFCGKFHPEKKGRDDTSTWCPHCGKCTFIDWREVNA